MDDLIRFDDIEARLDELKTAYKQAKPFPYVVIENFLTADALTQVHAHMPAPNAENKSSDYVFAKNKFENPNFAGGAEIFQRLRDALLGERFARLLSGIYGRELFVDPRFLGGGIHQGGEGSYLDMHADFSRHPANKDWLRELNILLYLNKDYDESYGGHLDLQNKETGERGRISPYENRLVLMLTKGHTLHGYKPINFPKGRFRTSLAAYAYSVDTDYSAVPVRSTQWKPEDASMAKSLIARASPTLVKLKTALLGSNTERRAAAADKDNSSIEKRHPSN